MVKKEIHLENTRISSIGFLLQNSGRIEIRSTLCF